MTISTGFFKGYTVEFDAPTIRREVERFARLLAAHGVAAVRVWCSWNPDLAEKGPLQCPERIVSPDEIMAFFDEAVRNGVWTYGHTFCRAGVDAQDESFTFFLGNDKELVLKTDDDFLLNETRSAWLKAGYEIN